MFAFVRVVVVTSVRSSGVDARGTWSVRSMTGAVAGGWSLLLLYVLGCLDCDGMGVRNSFGCALHGFTEDDETEARLPSKDNGLPVGTFLCPSGRGRKWALDGCGSLEWLMASCWMGSAPAAGWAIGSLVRTGHGWFVEYLVTCTTVICTSLHLDRMRWMRDVDFGTPVDVRTSCHGVDASICSLCDVRCDVYLCSVRSAT